MTDNETGGGRGTRGADDWPEPNRGAEDWPAQGQSTEDWPEPGQDAQNGQGMWQPVPHGGEYDAEATAFVQLPPEDDRDAPLAAPGHGYVPPMITPLQPDPSVAGTWGLPDPQAEAAGQQHYTGAYGQDPYASQPGNHDQAAPQGPYGNQDPYAQDPYGQAPYGQAPYGQGPYGHDPRAHEAPVHEAYEPARHTDDPRTADPQPHVPQAHDPQPHDPRATGHWNFTEAMGGHEPGRAQGEDQDQGAHPAPVEGTGQWRIPLATGDVLDESGELSAALAASPWNAGAVPPATLPGGARAPWAPEPAPEPAVEPEPEPEPEYEPEPGPPQHDEVQHGWAPTAEAVAEARAASLHEPAGLAPDPATARPDTESASEDVQDAGADATEEGSFETPPGRPVPSGVPEARQDDDPEAEAAAAGSGAHGTAEPVTEESAEPARSREFAEADAFTAAGSEEFAAPAEFASPARPETAARPEPEPRAEDEALAAPVAGPHPGPVPVMAPHPPGEPRTAAEQADEAEHAEQADHDRDEIEHPSFSYVLRVNGQDRPVNDAWIGESLLYVLRERLGLAGAKDGCSQGECGACNVQVDGRLVASCLVPAATTAGSEVRTVEGLATNGEPSDVQRALAACGAVQCGFCIPGMAMTVHDLLEGNHAPSELETRQALSGNLCRCSGYRGVLEAVGEVAAARAAGTEAAAAHGTAQDPAAAGPSAFTSAGTPNGSTGAASADAARIPHQAPPGAGGVQTQAAAQAPQGPNHPHANDGGMA
ncbi:(2Fe-2S)-binding protein [Streptomyces sp. NBC_01497]|uniref:(2Fe-2S)-binding protein n=1 Tax=Streptomyces sp. NBC_01497 TaxID=2903885 RepID=UPI002E34F76F|nr:2Fe-2S iron-sulfur cluster-binding protein [Streptomyces sp. NBC_01497]